MYKENGERERENFSGNYDFFSYISCGWNFRRADRQTNHCNFIYFYLFPELHLTLPSRYLQVKGRPQINHITKIHTYTYKQTHTHTHTLFKTYITRPKHTQTNKKKNDTKHDTEAKT